MNNLKWPLVANTQISEYLKKSIINNKVGGAYIFSGPDNLGKTTIAKFFAKILFCREPKRTKDTLLPCGFCSSCQRFFLEKSSPLLKQKDLNEIYGDFHIIKKAKDKKNISISQVRDFIRILNLSSFGGFYKIGIIKHAESLSREASNALLKTLEEPKDGVVIILITQNIDSLPATIISRSQILQFKPVKSELIYNYLIEDYGVKREKARNISRLCLGRPALAVKFLEDKVFYNFYNDKAEALLDMRFTDINGRFQIIDSFLDKKTKGQEAVRIASRILEIWQGVVRDCLLLLFGYNNIVQHVYLQDKLKKARAEYNLSELIKLSKVLSEAHIFLKSNVNPRLVFENIALNI